MGADTNRSENTSSDALGDEASDDPVTETYYTRFEPNTESESIVVAILETVATATDRDVIAMSPLFATVDTEALVALVASPRKRPGRIEVTFSYEGCLVTVSSRGDVVVEVAQR